MSDETAGGAAMGGRVLHITLHKCGSQWVRDVLCAPEIMSGAGIRYSGVKHAFENALDIVLPDAAFSGPLYRLRADQWRKIRREGDKAIVVLRDPRDILVSMIFSLLYSHREAGTVPRGRQQLIALNPSERIVLHIQRQYSLLSFFEGWADYREDDVYVTTYERLIGDSQGEFGNILAWLGWPVSGERLAAVVDRLSFEERSGRPAGAEDVHSHFRKGVAGDWVNHFSRRHGLIWEALYPGFLARIGYAKDGDWWKSLPVRASPPAQHQDEPGDGSSTGGSVADRRRLEYLEMEAEQKEAVIRSLSEACMERLELIQRLQRQLDEKERQIALLNQACNERLALIDKLDGMVRSFSQGARPGTASSGTEAK